MSQVIEQGGGLDPAKILFEPPRVLGDSSAGGGTRQAAAGNSARGSDEHGAACDGLTGKAYDMTHACDVIRESSIAPTPQARMGTGGNQVPLVLSPKEIAAFAESSFGGFKEGAISATLKAHGGTLRGGSETLILSENGNDRAIGAGVSPPLKTATTPVLAAPPAVRRLTPEECERLQGFPPGWSKVPYRGKTADQCPDSPRYKAIGNSWAVPVVRWLGKRIKEEIEK